MVLILTQQFHVCDEQLSCLPQVPVILLQLPLLQVVLREPLATSYPDLQVVEQVVPASAGVEHEAYALALEGATGFSGQPV